MRCPKCFTETPTNAVLCPSCKLPTPTGKAKLKERRKKKRELYNFKPVKGKPSRKIPRVKPWVATTVAIVTVLMVGAGSYYYTIRSMQNEVPSPSKSQIALEKLRNMPASIPGLSIDEYLNEEMEKSREAGRLAEAEGWSITPLQNEDEFLISFSYEEKDQQQKKAEWRVNVRRNIYQAQNEMAKKIHSPATE
jgi:hypothetical protein